MTKNKTNKNKQEEKNEVKNDISTVEKQKPEFEHGGILTGSIVSEQEKNQAELEEEVFNAEKEIGHAFLHAKTTVIQELFLYIQKRQHHKVSQSNYDPDYKILRKTLGK